MTRARGATSVLAPLGVAGVIGAAAWMTFRPSADGELALPRAGAGPDSIVPGFSGASDGLAFRLAPMHADPRRQDFETATLRLRFERAAGAPFRLEIEAAADALGSRIDLATCRVVDDQGTALDVLQRASELPRDLGAPSDPVRALFAARSMELVPGDTARVILWGRPPAAGARLELEGRPAVPLTAREWAADPMEDVLARRPSPPEEELGR